MQGRPSSSRPSTSARPTTAFDRDQFQYQQHHLQQQQPHEIEEGSEEESDDEDVFAFLPPTTADQEQQSTSQSPLTVLYPQPTFNPWDRQYPITPPSAPPGIAAQTHPLPHPHNKPPISPPSPSTDSQPSTGMSGLNLYRLKKLGTAVSSKLGFVDNVEGEKKADVGSRVDTDKETYPSDITDLERDTSRHPKSRAAISPSKNPNALPYKMYSQQASSYYGRDVRTGSASASGVGMCIPYLPSLLSKPLS